MPTPREGESHGDFMNRCMAWPDLQDREPDQRAAICHSLYRRGKGMPDESLLSVEAWKHNASPDRGLIKTYQPEEIKVWQDQESGLPKSRFVISTETRDRDGDTLSSAGWGLDNYMKNPVVLYGHSAQSLPIGQTVEIGVNKDSKLVSIAQFDTDIEDHPLPRTVVALLKRGTLRSASVGFLPLEWKAAEGVTDQAVVGKNPIDFARQELVEWSIVPVPSNPEALLQAKAEGVDIAPVVNWAGQVLEMYGGAARQGLWVPRSVLEKIAVIGSPTIFKAPDGGWTLEAKTQPVETVKAEVKPEKIPDPPKTEKKQEPQEDRMPTSKDILSQFDRLQKIERRDGGEKQFTVEDGIGQLTDSKFSSPEPGNGELCLLLHGKENGNSGPAIMLGKDRGTALSLVLETIESRKDPTVVALVGLHLGKEGSHEVFEVVSEFNWKASPAPAPAPAPAKIDPNSATVKDVVEAIDKVLGPALKAALAEVTGNVGD